MAKYIKFQKLLNDEYSSYSCRKPLNIREILDESFTLLEYFDDMIKNKKIFYSEFHEDHNDVEIFQDSISGIFKKYTDIYEYDYDIEIRIYVVINKKIIFLERGIESIGYYTESKDFHYYIKPSSANKLNSEEIKTLEIMISRLFSLMDLMSQNKSI